MDKSIPYLLPLLYCILLNALLQAAEQDTETVAVYRLEAKSCHDARGGKHQRDACHCCLVRLLHSLDLAVVVAFGFIRVWWAMLH